MSWAAYLSLISSRNLHNA